MDGGSERLGFKEEFKAVCIAGFCGKLSVMCLCEITRHQQIITFKQLLQIKPTSFVHIFQKEVFV